MKETWTRQRNEEGMDEWKEGGVDEWKEGRVDEWKERGWTNGRK